MIVTRLLSIIDVFSFAAPALAQASKRRGISGGSRRATDDRVRGRHLSGQRENSGAHPMTIVRFLLVASALLAACPAFAQTSVGASRDGLDARLTIEGATAHVAWRFGNALPAPLRELTASFNGRPLVVSAAAGYPRATDKTAVMFFVDITGGAPRREGVYLAKSRLLRLYDSLRAHHQVALAVIDGDTKVVLPDGDDGPDPLAAMLQLKLSEAAPDLGSAIEVAIDALGDSPAPRKAAYILTDGAAEPPLDAATLAADAKRAGVAINLLVDRSTRPADTDALRKIAGESGGIYAEGEAVKTVVEQPFLFLDSGGFADIALGSALHYPWEEEAKLTASLPYADKRLELVASFTARPATVKESALYLWTNHGREIAVGGAAVGWVMALGGFASAVAYRQRLRRRITHGKGETEANNIDLVPPSDATLHSTADDGQPEVPDLEVADEPPANDAAAYELTPVEFPPRFTPVLRLYKSDGDSFVDLPLEGDGINIGRAADNDIALREATVSSRQARLVLNAGGGYALENLSRTNPTRINDESFQHHDLRDGDRIDLGGVKAMFVHKDDAGT